MCPTTPPSNWTARKTTSSIPGCRWETARVHAHGFAIEPCAQDRDVVRGEAPHRVSVTADDPEVEPAHGDIIQLTQQFLAQVVANGEDGAVVLKRVADHQH